jgi:hypothetical protein
MDPNRPPSTISPSPSTDAAPAGPHDVEAANRASLPPWGWIASLALLVLLLLHLFTR